MSVLIAAPLVMTTAEAAHATAPSTVLGDLSYQKYDTHALADRQNLSVNVADGNLIFQSEDLNIKGTGPALSVTQSFNNMGSGSGQVGNRNTLSVGADVHVTANGDGSATYQGPSGFQVVFPSNGSGGYTLPAAYTEATLAKVVGGGWKLSVHKSGEVYTFNAAGNQTKDASANGEAITYAYNANGTLASATDTHGRVTTFANYVGTDVGLIQDSTGRGLNFGYTSGNLTGFSDGAGKYWQFGYTDGAGNLNQIYDPNNNLTVLVYNSAKQVTSITYDSGTSSATTWTYAYNSGHTVVTDPLGHATTYDYDAQGRVTSVVNALGDTYGSSYDANNNQTSSTNPSNQSTTLSYDGLNNLMSIQNPNTASGAAGAMSSFTYGNAAHPYLPKGGTDAQGNLVAYSYDTNGNLLSAKSTGSGGTGMGSATKTIQGTAGVNCGAQPGEVCTSSDANGNVTSYGYDSLGMVTTVTPPGPVGRETIGYDALSRPNSVTSGNGASFTITYDGNDRPSVLTYSDGTHVHYYYDGDGNLVQRDDSVGTTQWAYDGRNRVTQITPAGRAILTYTYDGAGNLWTEAGPAGTTTYTYDKANQIAGINQSASGANESFTFQHGRPVTIALPGRIVETIGYDTAGRETSITAVRTNANRTTTTLTNFTGSYTTSTGADSAVLQTETNNLTGVRTALGYDGLNRLTAATGSGSGANTYGYTYDKNGNRTKTSTNGTSSPLYGFNAANELTTSGGVPHGSYDQAGNQTATGTGLAMAYNAKNQTASFTPSGQSALPQSYTDADQNGRTQNGNTSQENGLLGVYSDTTAGATTYYTHLPTGTHQALSETVGTTSYYYLTDLQGSVVDVTNTAGSIADTYTYDPYGNTLTSTGGVANPWRYAGGYYDNATALYKFGERYYNPADGRWTQLDPSGKSPGYLYAGDDPVNLTDPSGLVSVSFGWGGIYINFSHSDLENIAIAAGIGGFGGAAAAICAPGIVAAIGCGVIGGVVGYIVSDAIFNAAVAPNCNLQVNIALDGTPSVNTFQC